MQKRLKAAVKLSGNEHLSLVDAADESKVFCHIFPFPADQCAQTLGERDGTEAYPPIDEERCQIIHTLAGSHFLPVKYAMQVVAAIRSMQAGDMLQLSRHRPVEEGSNMCLEVELKLYNGRFRGWDFETEAQMTKEKRKLLDTGRVVRQDIRVKSAPVPEADLVRFHMCGPPDCDYDEIRECYQQMGRCNYAKLHQRITKMWVAPSTSTVQVQTDEPDDAIDTTVSASQTDDALISNEIKKRVLLELGMGEELTEACIEFPEELCLRLQDFTDTYMPSSSYQRRGEARMESDSDDDGSEESTATTARRAWELQGDEPQNDEEDEQNDENDEQNTEQNEELTGTDGIHENVPGDSQEPSGAAARTVGSVKLRFAADRVTDVYWQKVWQEYQKGNLIVTQEDLEYFREAHPIAKALAECDSNPFDPQIQAMIAASQGTSDWIDPSEVITPRRHEWIESPISIRRQQPVTES